VQTQAAAGPKNHNKQTSRSINSSSASETNSQ